MESNSLMWKFSPRLSSSTLSSKFFFPSTSRCTSLKQGDNNELNLKQIKHRSLSKTRSRSRSRDCEDIVSELSKHTFDEYDQYDSRFGRAVKVNCEFDANNQELFIIPTGSCNSIEDFHGDRCDEDRLSFSSQSMFSYSLSQINPEFSELFQKIDSSE